MPSTKPRFAVLFLLLGLSGLIVGVSFSGTTPVAMAPATLPALATTQPAITIEPHFAPDEEISPTITKLIDGAQHTLDIAAYAFTNPSIGDAVIRAHKRGVQVQIVMDLKEASARDSCVPDLTAAGITVHIRHKDGDQHSKYLIIDNSILMTGSYNFTLRADERNSENVVVIRNAGQAVNAFSRDYQSLLAAAVRKD